jgi:predicted  nucleic acid-binding Zn-ribbon protein
LLNLEEQEAKLSKYKLEHNGDLPEQEGSLMGKLERCNIELQASHDAINRIEQSKNVLEGEIASAEAYRSAILSGALDSTPAAASAGNASSALAGQLKQTAEKPSQRLRRQLEELRLRYTPDYPAVKELQLQLNEALKQEEQQEKEQRKLEDAARAQEEARRAAEKARPNSVAVAAARTRPEVAQLLMREQERITLLKTQLANADAEVANLKQKQEDLSAKIAELQERIEQIPIRQQEMAGLLRDYDISSANYRSLLSKDFTADMASDMEKRQKSERFMVLDPARPPEKPSKPNRPLFNSIAIFVSLLLGIAVGFGLEWKKNVFLGEWELPVGTPILGRVPPIRTLRSDSEPPESSRGAAPFRFKLRIRWVYPVIVSLTVLLLIGLWLKK